MRRFRRFRDLRGFVIRGSVGVDAVLWSVTVAARLSAHRDFDFLHVQFVGVLIASRPMA